ncbi:MAG: hypothetical protein R2856_39575 [Caldilineaceae bacterium]
MLLLNSSSWPIRRAPASWFNGDDAVVLRKGGADGEIVDSIGQIGVDPGSQWRVA